MSITFPPDLEQFVQQELATEQYPSRDDLVMDAVRRLRDTKQGISSLRAEIQRRVSRVDRGEGIEFDDESLAQFFEELEAEVLGERSASGASE